MLTLPLDPTDDLADPVFKDAAGCAQWLGQLQLTNLSLAHSQLLTQINELNRYPMRGLERLNILELLRETVSHVQEDFAKKLTGKPLPLNEGELRVFLAIVQLWQALVTGYQRGLQACIAGDKSLDEYGALLCQRCLLYSGLKIIEHLRTGYELDPGLWRQLHELYGYAEQQEIHRTEVPDPLNHSQTSCTASYVKTLLVCYAGPAQLTRRQLQQSDRWLSLWSNAVTVERHYSRSKNDAQPLATDLSGTRGLQPTTGLPHHDAIRYLTMVPLSKLLRVKTILLQQGQTPLQVGLGDHSDRHVCLELLTLLHSRWCENLRSCQRRQVNRDAALCYSPDGIYAQLTPFGKLDSNTVISSPAQPDAPALENWQIENESIMGACLTRNDSSGARLNYQQLIALRPGDAQSFMLGATTWVKVIISGELKIGVKFLPGRPEPVRIRAFGINPTNTKKHAPAFLLPALPSLNTPASLILPLDWFQAMRRIEILYADGNVLIAQLGFSVERGMNYERVSFTTKHVASSY